MYLSLVLFSGATPLRVGRVVLNAGGAGGVFRSAHHRAVPGFLGVGVRGRGGGGVGGGVWTEQVVRGTVCESVHMYMCVYMYVCVCVCMCVRVCARSGYESVFLLTQLPRVRRLLFCVVHV